MSPEEKEIMKMNKKLAQTRSTAGSEDCLHLSVHTPRVGKLLHLKSIFYKKGDKKRWLHEICPDDR